MHADFSEKLTILTPWYTHMCAYHGVRNISFSENNAYVLNGWFLTRILCIKLRYDDKKKKAVVSTVLSIIISIIQSNVDRLKFKFRVWLFDYQFPQKNLILQKHKLQEKGFLLLAFVTKIDLKWKLLWCTNFPGNIHERKNYMLSCFLNWVLPVMLRHAQSNP